MGANKETDVKHIENIHLDIYDMEKEKNERSKKTAGRAAEVLGSAAIGAGSAYAVNNMLNEDPKAEVEVEAAATHSPSNASPEPTPEPTQPEPIDPESIMIVEPEPAPNPINNNPEAEPITEPEPIVEPYSGNPSNIDPNKGNYDDLVIDVTPTPGPDVPGDVPGEYEQDGLYGNIYEPDDIIIDPSGNTASLDDNIADTDPLSDILA